MFAKYAREWWRLLGESTWLVCMQDGRAGCSLERLGIAQEFLANISPTLEGVSRTAVRAPGLGRHPLTSGFSAGRNKVKQHEKRNVFMQLHRHSLFFTVGKEKCP